MAELIEATYRYFRRGLHLEATRLKAVSFMLLLAPLVEPQYPFSGSARLMEEAVRWRIFYKIMAAECREIEKLEAALNG